MNRLIFSFLFLLSVGFLFLLILFLQFDPAEALKSSLKIRLNALLAPATIDAEEFSLSFKWPLSVRSGLFAIRIGNSAIKAEEAVIPITFEEILSRQVNPRKLILRKTSFVFHSLENIRTFVGGFFQSVYPSRGNAEDFLIQGHNGDFSYRDSSGFFPDLTFAVQNYSIVFASDGFRKFQATLSASEASRIKFDFSSDPNQRLAILALSQPETFEAKAEFYPENSRVAYRIQAALLGVDPTALIPEKWKRAEFIEAPLKGKLSAHSAADGTLRARASLEASPGVLRGINIPYEALRSLSRLPLFSHLMEGEWQTGLFKDPSTPFVAAQGEIAVTGKSLLFEELIITHPDYEIVLSGGINFSLGAGTVNFEGEIFITGSLAEELLEKEPLLEALSTPDGLRLAFLCLGSFPGIKVETDINDAARQILEMESEQIAAKGIDSLNRYMESKK
jgi:hypothetical protein